MVNKKQIISGIKSFIDSAMIPQAEGNYKIILRIARAGIDASADKIWQSLKENSLVKMLNIIDENEEIDLEAVESLLVEGLDKNEFEYTFKILGTEYQLYFTADDVHKLKTYIARA